MPLTRPTTTPLPDEIYDVWAPLLGEAELKVLLYIVRRTLGFRKNADAISLTQFLQGVVARDGRVLDHGCGVKSRRSVVGALKSLEDRCLIQSRKAQAAAGDRDTSSYALWWDDDVGGGVRGPLPGVPRLPRWCPENTEVVSPGHYRSGQGTPTTNSIPTNSQQNSETTRAPARAASPDHQPLIMASEERRATHNTADAIWRSVLEEVRGIMTAENYATWFAPTTALNMDGRDLIVTVPSDAHYYWLDTRLRRRIDDTLRRLGHPDVCVRFAVAS